MELVYILEEALIALYNDKRDMAIDLFLQTINSLEPCLIRSELITLHEDLSNDCALDEAQSFLLSLLNGIAEEKYLEDYI